MEIKNDFYDYDDHRLNLKNLNVLDIGGGPVSLLLRSYNLKSGAVIDPAQFLSHIPLRYQNYNIKFYNKPAEELDQINFENKFDETWIYNCLQHTYDAQKILDSVCKITNKIRILEPINAGIDDCHLFNFSFNYFDDYFSKYRKIKSKSIFINKPQNHCVCQYYCGIIEL